MCFFVDRYLQNLQYIWFSVAGPPSPHLWYSPRGVGGGGGAGAGGTSSNDNSSTNSTR